MPYNRNQEPVVLDENGDEIPMRSRWDICDVCGGEGQSSAYLGAFTSSEWHEACHDDPDFGEDYMSGRYDQPCNACGGSGKVRVPRTDDPNFERWQKQECDEMTAASERAYVQRMGF